MFFVLPLEALLGYEVAVFLGDGVGEANFFGEELEGSGVVVGRLVLEVWVVFVVFDGESDGCHVVAELVLFSGFGVEVEIGFALSGFDAVDLGSSVDFAVFGLNAERGDALDEAIFDGPGSGGVVRELSLIHI